MTWIIHQKVSNLFSGSTQRPTGLSRSVLLVVGLLSVGGLLVEHGFVVNSTITFLSVIP